jgi:hypothetical protein
MTDRFVQLWLFLLLASWLLDASQADLGLKSRGEWVEKKCVPLRVVTEADVRTWVGQVCAEFKDETQEWLVITYDTTSSYYVLDEVNLYYGSSVQSVPSATSGKPEPFQFPIKKEGALQQVVSVEVQLDRLELLSCPSTEAWTQYIVAHAIVHLPDSNVFDEVKLDVYGHESFLYGYTDVDQGQTEQYSYWALQLQCHPVEGGQDSPQRTNEQEVVTVTPTAYKTDTPTAAPSDVITPAPTKDITDAPTEVTGTTEAPSQSTIPPREEKPQPQTTTPATTTLPPSAAPSVAPSATPAPSLVAGEDLVVGMSFIVMLPNSNAEVPNGVVQNSYEHFARNVLEEMHVQPNMSTPPKGHRSRQLWVQYYDTSFKVYEFVVKEDCSGDEHEQALAKPSSLRPPPEGSQCQRAYARLTIRLANEDPGQVCEMLREGTHAAYKQGRLQEAHQKVNPDSPLHLKPGDFEYCVPIDEFTAPDHGEENWVDSNPLSTILVLEDEEENGGDNKDWLWILLLLLGLSCCLLCCWFGHRVQLQESRNTKKASHMRFIGSRDGRH